MCPRAGGVGPPEEDAFPTVALGPGQFSVLTFNINAPIHKRLDADRRAGRLITDRRWRRLASPHLPTSRMPFARCHPCDCVLVVGGGRQGVGGWGAGRFGFRELFIVCNDE